METAVGTEYRLGAKPVQIGRHSACTVRLNHPCVSSVHAQVRPAAEAGRFVLADLKSSNGTFRNGQVVRRPVLLEDGDRLQIGAFALSYRSGALFLLPRQPGLAFSLDRVSALRGREGKRPLRGASLEFASGRLTGIVGLSGAGKSTLLRLIAGLIEPDAGEIRVDGEAVDLRGPLHRQQIAYVPQEVILPSGLKVAEVLQSAHLLRGLPGEDRRERISAVIRQVKLDGKVRERAASPPLSGGELRRVNIAVELLSDPQALLLDEPTSGLDPSTGIALIRYLRSLAMEGRTVIVVTHAPHEIGLLQDVVVVGKGADQEGRVLFSGPTIEATRTLGVTNIEEIYARLAEPAWVDQIGPGRAPTPSPSPFSQGRPSISVVAPRRLGTRHSWGRQALHLTLRSLRGAMRDRAFVLSSVIQAVVIGVAVDLSLMAWDSKDYLPFTVLVGIWFGLTLSIRECVRERRLFTRERLRGMLPSAYFAGKVASLLVLLAAECALFLATQWVGRWAFGQGLGAASQVEAMGTAAAAACIAGVVAILQGLFVSSLANSEASAVAALPMLMIFQVLFSSSVLKQDDPPVPWQPWNDEDVRIWEKKYGARAGPAWGLSRWACGAASLATISRPTWELCTSSKMDRRSPWETLPLLAFQAVLFGWLALHRLSHADEIL